jgi:hypothetical protein
MPYSKPVLLHLIAVLRNTVRQGLLAIFFGCNRPRIRTAFQTQDHTHMVFESQHDKA